MTRYYIANPKAERGFDEVTEAEWLAIIGDDEHGGYAGQVYRGEITINEVPEEARETVATIVANRIERYGEYAEQDISADELGEMVEEAIR